MGTPLTEKEDGTVHLSHRFLDTFTLNFTQPDPSLQELNNHTYAVCDPINNTDPTGLMGCGFCVVDLIGSGIGLVGSVTATGITLGAASFFLGVSAYGALVSTKAQVKPAAGGSNLKQRVD